MPKNEFIPPHPLNTAVLFLVFNRPETTRKVFEAIRKAKPPRLYVAADGPREDRLGEEEKVHEVRDYVLSNTDWDCEVKTLFRDRNLGCKYAVSGAITWFFEHEEMGIILEDDCLPSQSFFWFCEELLEKYKDDERIYLITGTNLMKQYEKVEADYLFSVYGGIWGWASWSRVWKQYDTEMKLWGNSHAKFAIRDVLIDNYDYERRKQVFDQIYSGKIDTWDYQFGFIRFVNSGLSIVPSKNLISNIGEGVDATHIKNASDKRLNLPIHNLILPLKHNIYIVPNREYDNYFIHTQNQQKRIIATIKKIPGLYNILSKIKRFVLRG